MPAGPSSVPNAVRRVGRSPAGHFFDSVLGRPQIAIRCRHGHCQQISEEPAADRGMSPDRANLPQGEICEISDKDVVENLVT